MANELDLYKSFIDGLVGLKDGALNKSWEDFWKHKC